MSRGAFAAYNAGVAFGFRKIRIRGGLTIPQSSLLAIPDGGDTYGLHPSMPEMQALYLQKKAAILANVGMLAAPFASRAAYQAAPPALVPQQLFSHSDQTGPWQTATPTGLGSSGWVLGHYSALRPTGFRLWDAEAANLRCTERPERQL